MSFILKEFQSPEGSGQGVNNPLAMLCDQFLKERHYFKNVCLANS